jgi:hypothetical protein
MQKIEINPYEDWVHGNFLKTLELVETNFSKEHGLYKLLDTLGDRYALCPASLGKEHYSSFPGGLAYHNLHTLKWVSKFANLMAENEISRSSMILVSILHEIGKIGTMTEDYFIRRDGKYFDDKGLYYDYNPKIQYMKISQRSLALAQEIGIILHENEYLAILLHDGYGDNEHASFYRYREPILSIVLQNAVTWARRLEKNSIVYWPSDKII